MRYLVIELLVQYRRFKRWSEDLWYASERIDHSRRYPKVEAR